MVGIQRSTEASIFRVLEAELDRKTALVCVFRESASETTDSGQQIKPRASADRTLAIAAVSRL